MRRLPDEIKRGINRLAHALAQAGYTEHRRQLEAEALALMRAGRNPGEVLAQLSGRVVPER